MPVSLDTFILDSEDDAVYDQYFNDVSDDDIRTDDDEIKDEFDYSHYFAYCEDEESNIVRDFTTEEFDRDNMFHVRQWLNLDEEQEQREFDQFCAREWASYLSFLPFTECECSECKDEEKQEREEEDSDNENDDTLYHLWR